MRDRRLHPLRGYGPVVALATAFLAVSALTGPARRLQLTIGADAGAATTPAAGQGAAALPADTGTAASGGAAAADAAGGPATTRPSGPTAPRRVTRTGRAGAGGADAAGQAAAPPIGTVTPCSDRARQIPKDPYSTPCMAFTGYNGGATSRGV